MSESDVSTVVSIMPFRFYEPKPGCFPNLWVIEAVKKGEFQVLYVENVCTWEYIDEQRGSRQYPISSKEFAEALVKDSIRSMMAYDVNAHPGLMVLNGRFSKEDIKNKLGHLIKELNDKQNLWFKTLVELADADFAETHSVKFITEHQKLACTALGLKREWNIDIFTEGTKECPACISVVPARATVCRYCQTKIDFVPVVPSITPTSLKKDGEGLVR